ncbi:MAG: hypothetical protein M0Z41_14370 [Peptococcaceae bacterium]|nr:hypothetical protein [Peptococcaceae bacterium]
MNRRPLGRSGSQDRRTASIPPTTSPRWFLNTASTVDAALSQAGNVSELEGAPGNGQCQILDDYCKWWQSQHQRSTFGYQFSGIERGGALSAPPRVF